VDRNQALDEVKKRISNPNLIKHMIATEAVMRALAQRLGGDEKEWALAGLLHDIDLDECQENMSVHSQRSSEIASEFGCSGDICRAILTHNETHGIPPKSVLERALFCADPVTGLVTAAALVRPEKKLAAVELKSLSKRFKEKIFAAGANREQIASCSTLGISLEEFLDLSLKAMQGVAEELGL
jgi:putative nucleotidyltransferase with HDIG domain